VDKRIASATEYIARIDAILAVPEGITNQPVAAGRVTPANDARVETPVAADAPGAAAPRKASTDNMDLVRDLIPSWAPGVREEAPPKQRRMLLAAISGFVVVLGIVAGIFVFGMREPPPDEKPYAAMSLGHEQARKDMFVPALIAYEEAISLDPKLVNNKRMRDNVERMLHKDSSPEVADAAIDLLGTLVTAAGDGPATTQLIDLASASKDLRRRQHAMTVANEVGLGKDVDHLASYTLDLKQGATCADRKAAISKLRALGDKRAVPALRKARNRPRGGLGRKRVNTNACLRAAANEAVRHLQGL
ncbi:MAG: hypothetical protein AAF436_18845, partial [Myxococcota bacterium]